MRNSTPRPTALRALAAPDSWIPHWAWLLLALGLLLAAFST